MSQPAEAPFLFDPPSRPDAWYLLAPSSAVRRGRVVTRRVCNEEVVLFRTGTGAVGALAAHCWHMGAHLGNGCVVGERLQCPLHHWEWDGEGACAGIPGEARAPAAARQPGYPVAERLGGIWVWMGGGAPGPVPGLETFDDAELLYAHGDAVRLRCPWYAPAANGFDEQHLSTVHGRALRERPRVDFPEPHRMRMRYLSRVTGHGVADRMMKRLSGDHIRVQISCWGGTTLTVESDVGRTRSALLLAMIPVGHEVEVTPVFTSRRGGVPGVDRVRLAVARFLFSRFIQKDVGVMDGMRFRPRLPLPGNEPLETFLRWASSLPGERSR
ncbi:MAG: Rieske 2Fe-2S domain-containing protein [Gemmatimonadetes bacterium]|nr:Rieske 2Fe-2S domain-containing protein [Gemmatimonadota bacterium]